MMLKKVNEFIKEKGFILLTIKILNKLSSAVSFTFFSFRLRRLLDLLGCHYGKKLKTDGKIIIRVEKRSSISIGDNFKNNSRYKSNLVGLTNPTTLQCFENGSIIIGNNTGFSGVIISSRKRIKIGDNVMIGGNVRIFDHDYHSLDYRERNSIYGLEQKIKSSEIIIGNDVFIGTNAIILKGVKIGDRTIIGANALVANIDIPPDSIVIGNPAKIIKIKNPKI